MKFTLRIARLELSNLFFSPVAWVVLIIFLVQSGWEYTSLIERFERAQQLGSNNAGITDSLFAGFVGVFTKMKENLFLYIPLLTMGLISRETSSGSIKLVYSSPVRVSAFVWGKYLAMVLYCLLLMACLLLLCVCSSFIIKDADLSFILSGITGLFLQICAYSAIGLFMSSLTTYQVVAAISTLVVLAALNYVGKLWQDIDFVRDLTYFLSLSGRVDEFIHGLITSRDVFYFVIVTGLFVGLTILKLKAGRESTPVAFKAMRYVLLSMAALLLGYVSSRPGWVLYKDMTANKSRTLAASSQEVLHQMKGPLTMTTYVNLLDKDYYRASPAGRNYDYAMFDKYFRFKPDIKMNYVYYYDTSTYAELYRLNKKLNTEQLAKRVATSAKVNIKDFLTPAEIKKKIDLSSEQNRLVRLLEYDGKKTFLRTYEDLMRQPNEQEITAAMKRLVVPVPKVAFLTEHQERSIRKLGDRDSKLSTTEITFRYALVNQGFEVLEVSADAPLPADLSVLVIADPGTAYTMQELEHINHYISGGGNLLVTAESQSRLIVNPLLSSLGISMNPGTLLQQSEDFAPDFLMASVSASAGQVWQKSSLLNNTAALIAFPGASTLSYHAQQGVHITPLINTGKNDTWRRTVKIADSIHTVKFDVALGDERDSMPIVLAATRQANGKAQKIIVSGDADFMSNSELLRSNPQTSNFRFTTEIFRWFSNNAFPVDTYKAPQTDDRLLIDAEGVKTLKWGLLGLLPALIALGVTALLVIRNRR
jgi:ABC-2 type transport system permease protein